LLTGDKYGAKQGKGNISEDSMNEEILLVKQGMTLQKAGRRKEGIMLHFFGMPSPPKAKASDDGDV
jgi:hypothetical protein